MTAAMEKERADFNDWWLPRRAAGTTTDLFDVWMAARSLAESPQVPVEAIEYALATMEVEREYLNGQRTFSSDSMADTWDRRLKVCAEHIESLRALLPKEKA